MYSKNHGVKTFDMVIDKKQLEQRSVDYVAKYGRGDKGLTTKHKKARIINLLGLKEAKKFKGLVDNLGVVDMFNSHRTFIIPDEHRGLVDCLPEEVKKNLKKYPNDPYRVNKDNTSKVLYVEVSDDGRLVMYGIHMNGKELDSKLRAAWGVSIANDKLVARATEIKQKKGVLKRLPDRALAIHKDNNKLDLFLNSPNLDITKDKEGDY